MTRKRTNRAAVATSGKTAVAKGRKRTGAANVEGHVVRPPALKVGARGKKRKKPFVL